jgi:hypothetical protein
MDTHEAAHKVPKEPEHLVTFTQGPFEGARVPLDVSELRMLMLSPETVLQSALLRAGVIDSAMTRAEFYKLLLASAWQRHEREEDA